jgi:hypothetical protein
MTPLETGNLVLRFVLEMCVLAALAYWGFTAFIPLGVIAPALAVLGWGTFVAPKARVRLEDPLRLGIEVLFFASGVIALVAAGVTIAAIVLAAAVSVHIALMLLLKQR